MKNEKVSVLTFTLFKDSEQSFILALDNAQIPHSRVQMFSIQPQASGIVESISALSEAMPWNSIAKVILAWIEARKSREVIITLDDGKVFHAKGYSAKEIQCILPESINIVVIDSKPNN